MSNMDEDLASHDEEGEGEERPMPDVEPLPPTDSSLHRISILENTMQLILDQMQVLTRVAEKGKRPLKEQAEPSHMPESRMIEDTHAVDPPLREAKWQLKDLNPPKFHGTVGQRTADAVEQWLSKWEQCFRLCHIFEDVMKIQQATYNLNDAAHRWWRKIEQDHAEPSTWVAFKTLFYNNFVPPDERTRALDSWFYVSQKSYSVQEYADKYREILLKVPEHIPDFLQVHKFVMGLKETIRPLVRKDRCKTLNEAVELALVLEDGKRTSQGLDQRFSWTRTPRLAFTTVATSSASRPKDTREVHMIKTVSGTKRKVSAIAERAYNKSILTPQQREKSYARGTVLWMPRTTQV
ncbi:hypothetical protein L7F22_017444 [Adiantum nelumboides]|nr:hypothetical protein [Adiantum nelumboides]